MDKNNDKSKEFYKDEVDDSVYKMESTIKTSLAARANAPFFFVYGAILLFLAKIYLSLPDAPMIRIYDLLGKPEISKKTSKMLLKFFKISFEQDNVNMFFLSAMLIVSLIILYYFLDAKLTEFSVNFRFLEMKKGVFNRTIDTIDLVAIKDQQIERPIIYRLLGLSRLIIQSTDKTHPVLTIGAIDAKMAEKLLNFLRNNSYQNSTEYWIAKDRRRRNENKNGKRNNEPVYNLDNDGGGNDGDDHG